MKRTVSTSLWLLLVLASSSALGQVGRRSPSQPVSQGDETASPFRSAAPQGGMDASIGDLSQQIAREMTDNRKRTVAVVEFVDLQGRVTDFGRFLAEELITRLHQTRKFKVIERQLLNKVIGEQKLSLTGIIDPTSAQKLGRLLGVDAIASGTVTDLGRSLRVNARLVDTTTAEIFAVASSEILKDEAVLKLTGGEGGVTGGGAEKPPEGRSQQKVNANFYTIELQQCRISGTTIICDFRVTNNDRDRVLGLSTEASMIDDSNNTFRVRDLGDVRLANASGSFISGKAETTLVSGVTAKARVTFTQVAPEARRIALLTLKWDSNGEFLTRFRDVPLGGAGR